MLKITIICLTNSNYHYRITKFSTQAGFKILFEINIPLMVFGLLFAFIIGMASGTLPARSASKLKPVEALRYE